MGESSGSGWLKYGCFGCLGVVIIGVVLVGALLGTAALQVGSEQIETPTIVHEATATAAGDGAAPDDEAPAPAVRPGRVSINMASAGFEVRPGRPGEPLRVEAEYDAGSYRLEERLTEADDGWSYELEFDKTGSGLMNLLKQIVGGSSPSVTVYLPVDTPIDLELDAFRAGGQVEMGGLWLRTASLHAEQGGFDFRVSDPLREPMDELTVDASMGGMHLGDLGNASPRVLEVTASMGGFHVDLDGAWRVDSEISIDVSRGEVNLDLPRGVVIEGLPGAAPALELREGELLPPTLRFSTRVAQSGEISVDGTALQLD